MKSPLASPLPFVDWPRADQLAWRRATEGDPLSEDGGGGGAKWRPASRRAVQIGYASWLGWLQKTGCLDAHLSPADRASRERARLYLKAMQDVGYADYTRAGRLQTLGDALRAMQPEKDRSFLGRAAGRIASAATRARDLRPRLRPPVEVLECGLDLMRRAEETVPSSRAIDRAYLYRDGLLIALWVHRDLRIANLAGPRLGQHLIEVGEGYRVEFQHDEMKGGRPFSCAWPGALTPALERYLQVHRPVLLARGEEAEAEPALWISQFGRAMPSGSVGQIIRVRTKARFGEALNPHLIRYLTATYYADARPEQRVDVPAMLGHASLKTSEQHYILANSLRAVAKFQEALVSQHGRGSRKKV